MHKLDEYESVFRASERARFLYESVDLEKILLVTDADAAASAELLARVQHFLRDTHKGDKVTWEVLDNSGYAGLRDLLEKIDAADPSLVVTLRCLTEEDKNPPFSLGVFLDNLTQVTKYPIMVLPDRQSADWERATDHLREVVAVTDHLAGDSRIINWAARFVPKEGKLVLTHVEDDAVFERYMQVIGKIPEIPTEEARERIMARLLSEPAEFIEDATRVFAEHKVPIEVEAEIRKGHVISDYQEVLDAHQGDLLVLNTKDEGQMAMHGNAYAIAIEYRHVALLLL